jgi:AcrR family transcriptional regulator
LRDIAREAGVELGLASYHFRTKDELFRQVMRRRAPVICGALLASLEEVETQAAEAPPGIEALLTAYAAPHIDRLASGDEGWRNYIKLAGHTAILEERDDLTAPLRELYEPVQRRYRAALYRALPYATHDAVDVAFYIFRLTVATVAGDGGWRGEASAQRPIGDYAALRRTLVRTFVSGFHGL